MIIYFFYNLGPFSLFGLTALARTSVNRIVRADILVLDFEGRTIRLSPLSMKFTTGVSDALNQVRQVPFDPNLSCVL